MSSILILTSIFLISCFSIFLINAFVDGQIKKLISEIESPLSVPFFKALLFIAFGLLIAELIETVRILQVVLANTNVAINVGDSSAFKEVSMLGAFFSIILFIYAIVVVVTALMHKLLRFKHADHKSIFASIANNEYYDLILFGAILITLTLAVKTGIGPVLDSFIPYPEVTNFR